MKGLVEDLLFLARSDDARLAFRPMETDLSQLVEGCLLPFEPVAFEAGVTLTAELSPGLTVHNTGDPIPPEHLPHLFERFYRADPSRDRAQGGYGLGLAIANSIVLSHRGRLTVTSTREAGTSFAVLLPRG